MDVSLPFYRCQLTGQIDADLERWKGNHKARVVSIVFSEKIKSTGRESARTGRSIALVRRPHAINIRGGPLLRHANLFLSRHTNPSPPSKSSSPIACDLKVAPEVAEAIGDRVAFVVGSGSFFERCSFAG